MNTKTVETIKGINDLGNEVSAWEVRLLSVKNENQQLQRQNAALKTEMESALKLAQQELDKKREQVRLEDAKIRESSSELEAKRVEFQVILKEFNKDKREFDDARSKLADQVKQTESLRQKLSNFALLVRREFEKF